MIESLAVIGFVLIGLPFCVFFTVKFGVLAYHRGTQLAKQSYERKLNGLFKEEEGTSGT